MNGSIEEMLKNYQIENLYDKKNAMKEEPDKNVGSPGRGSVRGAVLEPPSRSIARRSDRSEQTFAPVAAGDSAVRLGQGRFF